MDRTQRLRLGTAESAVHNGSEQQSLLGVIVAASLIIAIAIYMVLRIGPNLVTMVSPLLASLPPTTSANGWIGPSIAVGALLAGGSLSAVALAAFVRGVRQDPFRWLAPVLIAFSSVVMTRLGLERSMGPLPASLFGALTALLLLGGGVLVQAQGLVVACSGGVLLSLPVLGLLLDQVHSARGFDQLLLVRNPDSLLAMLVLAMTSVGVGLTAFVGKPNGSLARAAQRGREWERHRDQLGQALERARISELRLAQTEQRASELEQLITEHIESMEAQEAVEGAEAEFGALRPKRSFARAFIVFGVFGIGASLGAVALHALMLSPLQAQLVKERNAASTALAARDNRAGDVEGARKLAEAERTRLTAELATEKTRAEAALLEAKTMKEQLAALSAAAPATTEKAEPSAKEAPKAAKKSRAAHRAKRSPISSSAADRKVVNPELPRAVSDDPIGGL